MERIKLPKKVLSMLQGHGIEPEHILKIFIIFCIKDGKGCGLKEARTIIIK